MKLPFLKIASIAAAAAALAACAQNPTRDEVPPHHYSKDRDGNRIACYATDVANEYDCVPAYQRRAYAYAYDPSYYDPFWPYWGSGWYYGPRYVFVEPSSTTAAPPPPSPAPAPRPWPHRAH